MPLTLYELSSKSGISASHLGRIERNERFPSAHVLRRIAKHLEIDETELFMIAGFLSTPSDEKVKPANTVYKSLDPYVARALASEPLEVQRKIVDILNLMKNLARSGFLE